MKIRTFYALGLAFCFGGGIYAWRVLHTGRALSSLSGETSMMTAANTQAQGVLAEVGGAPITADDLEWEFNLHTKLAEKGPNMTPIPDLGPKYDREMAPLRQHLMAGMIERKMLYKYIQQDKKFDWQDSSRFTECLKEWQETVNAQKEFFASDGSRERLKSRLCENSVIHQYIVARVNTSNQITDLEIVEYFKNHTHELRLPERVIMRQIVFATEKAAKEARGKLNRNNFETYARQLSIAPEAQNGGKVGPFGKGELPTFFNMVFDLQPGQMTDILKSPYGFHIIMLVQKLPRQDPNLVEATPRIRKILEQKRREEEYQKWVELALHTISISTPKPIW